MSESGVRRLLGELIGDQSFSGKFFEDPEGAMRDSGFDLSDLEIDSLKGLNREDLELNINQSTSGLGSIDVHRITVM